MTDEYKTEKKGKDVWKRGSRPNEIISWHIFRNDKGKARKICPGYTVSKHTFESRIIQIRTRSASH
jgi:hypothetical protein